MKPFAGGQLLSKENSPLGISLTVPQCISYALDKPAVVTVLPGASNLNELKGLLTYLEATAVKKTTQFQAPPPQKKPKGAVFIAITALHVLKGSMQAQSINITTQL